MSLWDWFWRPKEIKGEPWILWGLRIAVTLWAVVVLYFEFGFAGSGPEVDRSSSVRVNEAGRVICPEIRTSLDFDTECSGDAISKGLLGQELVVVEGVRGLDPDDDNQLEWTCTASLPEPEGGSAWSCSPVDLAGPSSDSFLLTDGATRVERIDTDGDGKADLVKVGDEESKPIVEPTPWWQTLVGPSVIAAVVSGAFLLAGNRRKSEKSEKVEDQADDSDDGEGEGGDEAE